MTFQQIVALLTAFITGFFGNLYALLVRPFSYYSFTVDYAEAGAVLPNVRSHINRFGGRFSEDPQINTENDPYAFTEYIQLMECTGGSAGRDLFVDPDDYGVLDDYDFEPLLRSCRGILKTGAKPLLKLGNVPCKLSAKQIAASGADTGDFSVNVYPPDDYGAYADYIRAVAGALVGEFGLREVRTWRFGCLTEYENASWFRTPDGDPEATKEAYFKLYDYTVRALVDVLGPEVFVGAHSMSCSEGLWDEREFIRHCAVGVNYADGGRGTKLDYLAVSYYENRPGSGEKHTLDAAVAPLRATAEAYGLTDLIYGVDVGRVLCGNVPGAASDELYSRSAGFTWQAAFDAALIRQMFDNGISYFSNWEYCTLSENRGLPTVTYHVSYLASRFAGARLVPAAAKLKGAILKADVNISAAWDAQASVMRVMAYNYKNDLNYTVPAEVKIRAALPVRDGKATVTAWVIDDGCNYFDEWQAEYKSLGFTDADFAWSPDDGCPLWSNEGSRLRFESLQARFAPYAALKSETFTAEIVNGYVTIRTSLAGNTVAFYDIVC